MRCMDATDIVGHVLEYLKIASWSPVVKKVTTMSTIW